MDSGAPQARLTLMAKKDEMPAKQKTQPKHGKPVEIPVPKRSTFDKLVKKAAKAGGRSPKPE